MRYGYRRPSGVTWSVHGTGASIASDVRLDNGQPSEATAIQWLSEGSPTTADYIDLRAAWAAELPVRLLSMLGLSCGAGVRVVVTGRRAEDAGYTYALGGNSTDQDTVAAKDGRIEHIVEGDAGLDPLIGVQWRIYNDRASSTWATAATDLLIGEADIWSAVTLRGQAKWKRSRTDPSLRERTQGGGLHVAARQSWRSIEIGLSPEHIAFVRENGLENGEDWETLEAAAAGDSRALVIVRSETPEEIQRTALFGLPVWSAIDHRAGPLYGSALRVEEVR
jgi:hypothetical protein